MNHSPSKYAGLAAAAVFGVGLMILALNLPAERRPQTGALAFMMLFLLFAILLRTGWFNRALVVSLAAMICCVALVFSASRSEITGTTVYYHRFLMKRGWTEAVTRQQKPDMFREATNVRWTLSVLFAAVSVGSFVLYQKLEYLGD